MIACGLSESYAKNGQIDKALKMMHEEQEVAHDRGYTESYF
jgi:hypothetical protein